MGMYVRIALLTLICYSWWEEEQAWGLFAPDPDLESPLVLQVWVLGASYSSQQAGMFLTVLLLSSACSTKWAFVHWVSPYTTVLPTPFPPFLPQWRIVAKYSGAQCLPFPQAGQEFILPIHKLFWLFETHMCVCTQNHEQTHSESVSEIPADSCQLSHTDVSSLLVF